MRRTSILMLLASLSLYANPAIAEGIEGQFEPKDGVVLLNDTNQELYDAVAYNSSISFACVAVEQYAEKCKSVMKESAFKQDELRKAIKADKEVAAALQRARGALAKLTYRIQTKADKVDYENGAFWLTVAKIEGTSDWGKCQQADLYGGYTDGVTAGRSPLIRWSPIMGGNTIGRIELKGLSPEVKSRVDSEFGKSIHTVWQWTGLATPVQFTSPPLGGMVFTHTWLSPKDLRLLLVDDSGTILARFR